MVKKKDQSPIVSDSEAASFLENQDRVFGKNDISPEPTVESNPPKLTTPLRTSLGKSRVVAAESTISSANDPYWKTVPLENLPSRGLFYADGSELSIRSATVTEIRQWSTIDESDPLDIDDQLNFIIEKCCRFKINNGEIWLTWRDILEIDRLFVIFMIHEITFPKGQNELYAKFSCIGTCSEEIKFSQELKVHSGMLQIFDLPQELMEWYSQEYKCFEVVSAKLNETFYLYMPTIGVVERLRKRISELRGAGRKIDKAFIKHVPYLIQDWSRLDKDEYDRVYRESINWHINKLSFIDKFVDIIKDARETSIATGCPKCGSILTTPLFSKSSFTVKDLFLIPGRLNELI